MLAVLSGCSEQSLYSGLSEKEANEMVAALSLADMEASKQKLKGNELTPSEIVTLTTRSQEFMFYSQLTSNVANRTADGLQQLFRQQS